MRMPHLQTALGKLNIAFSKERIAKLVPHRDAFKEGQPLGQSGVVIDDKMAIKGEWRKFLGQIPIAQQEAIRAVIFAALGTDPATPITFAWAPGYDFEVLIWQAPDTRTSRGGITILIKSRYPSDSHPLANEPPYGS
ncbi:MULTISPECIES: hypothetical protein [unclassified Bradyrhizobium]|uniref:hypothetical protein n=1 Tax=unclassified Bradyrhizobium TaxID=2631580 RepID=UPI0028A4F02B|nr:hypothetical protein [Bradyrhizobium sp. WYCCWR 12699]MDT4742876.1 hypothetical protein [Bradyrhizobium sp. WYCCWR 12699]